MESRYGKHEVQDIRNYHSSTPKTNFQSLDYSSGGYSSETNLENYERIIQKLQAQISQKEEEYEDIIEKLQAQISQKGQEYEELCYEYREISEENKLLKQKVEEQNSLLVVLNEQVITVKETAYVLYNKLASFKRKYYEEKRNW